MVMLHVRTGRDYYEKESLNDWIVGFQIFSYFVDCDCNITEMSLVISYTTNYCKK